MARLTRLGFAIVWPPALVAGVYVAVGRLGFYPADEGLVLAYAYRILHGQVPHRDFISPRPLGSGLLHTADFLFPGPLLEVSRVIALCEYAAYAVLFAWLIYGVAPQRWSVVMAAGAAASTLVNLNVFPLMAWYTVDGLLLISAGCVLVRHGAVRNSRWVVALGFVLVGSAALTKQSFVPATAFAWVLLWDVLRQSSWRGRVGWLVGTGIAAAVPSLLFVTVIAALGGFDALLTQLLNTNLVYGRELLSAVRHDFATVAPAVGAVAIFAFGIETGRRRRDTASNLAFLLALRVVLSAAVVAIPVLARLGGSGNDGWGIVVFWMACAFWLVRVAVNSTFEPVGAALIGCAWMASLSYGFAYPNLVCGTLALYMLHTTWTGAKWPASWPSGRPLNGAPATAALAIFAVIAGTFYVARHERVYDDRPASQLVATLSSVSPAFGDIRTNPNTAAYLEELAYCVRQFPAKHVAILSENAALYPVLGLDNPFPIDWIWSSDIHGSEARIVATADQLNREGDYLVLFQTVGRPAIVNGNSLPQATVQSPVYSETPLPAEILARLNGTRATCGPFVVVYSPPA